MGLFPSVLYEARSVAFKQGDLVLAFTDGISEAMNSVDEEWGEDKLMEAARQCIGVPAAEVIVKLMFAADAFTAGAKQHDDMTLVTMKVL